MLARVMTATMLCLLAIGCTEIQSRLPGEGFGWREASLRQAEQNRKRNEDKARELLGRWGRGSERDDLKALEFLDECYTARGHRVELELLIKLIADRIAARPEIVRQWDWYQRGETFEIWPDSFALDGTLIYDDASEYGLAGQLKRCTERTGCPNDKFWALFLLASITDEPEVMCGLTEQNLDSRWSELAERLKPDCPYYYWDPATETFRLDIEAKTLKQPVAPERQCWTKPQIPLPGTSNRQSGK